ncbi:MAG: DegV family protein [Bacilli bacterium]|nr:DegV family protein [Mollicutes bacterium]MDY3899967.1 DegV family protein [Bacilli bacterium]
MKIGITADCSSGLEYAPFKHNIKITRTTIHFGEKELIDGIDITADEFYKELEASDIVPSTSAPTPKEIIRCVEEYRNEGCTTVIHFPISFGLSAYGENLQAVSDDYVEGVDLKVYNCNTACIMEGYTAHYAEILASKGYTVEEIFKECDHMSDNSKTYFLVDDLKYLVKNGRLNVVSGFIGGLMKIKPILQLGKNVDGKIEIFEKVRTHVKALERMFEVVQNETASAKSVIYIIQHSNRLEDAKKLVNKVNEMFNNVKRVEIATVTPTVGAHIGSGVLSLGYIITDNFKEEI